MSEKINTREYLDVIGEAMDWDAEHDVYGKPGTATIPWLHKKPVTYKDTFKALVSYLDDAGVTVTLTYDHEEVNIGRMLRAANIRSDNE